MKATLLPFSLPYPTGDTRSDGIHVSRVIAAIAKESGILKPDVAEDLSLVEVSDREGWWKKLPEGVRIKMSMGLAWEDWYGPRLHEVAYHPGEMQVDGIYMTHDGESLDVLTSNTGLLCLGLHEIKLTYKSTKTVGNLETQWMWLAQTRAYCKGLGTRVAFVHVLFACGDYKYPITPQLKVWRVEYTQDEINENWDLLMSYVRHRQLLEREEAGLEGGV